MRKFVIIIFLILFASCAPDGQSMDDRNGSSAEPTWYYLSMGTGAVNFDSDTPSFSGGEWNAEITIIINGSPVKNIDRGGTMIPINALIGENSLRMEASKPMALDVYMAFSRLVQEGDVYLNTVLWRKIIVGNEWLVKEFVFSEDDIHIGPG